AQKTILITGHTCDIGGKYYNKGLSIARAKMVNDWLINEGFSKHRLRYKGKGMSEPMKANTSEENRRWNRRVVIRLND
ncbi:OmpA family protein, partial [Desulfococcaceae bacterium HSG9]|nr:OmpA family protein [Desulfococcaceae bacterium HSG9]